MFASEELLLETIDQLLIILIIIIITIIYLEKDGKDVVFQHQILNNIIKQRDIH